jgi:hypothetical protein
MYELNGIAYASNPTPDIRVAGVRDVGNRCLVVTFTSGEERLLDTTELLSMSAFAPLSDPAVAASAKVDRGVLTWLDGAVDLAPEATYEMSYEYVAPPKGRCA